MLTLSAFDDSHERVVGFPEITPPGFAEMLTVGFLFTVTVVLAVPVPAGPVTVIVYVVVSEGLTVTDPLVATAPMPWSMVALAASVEVQDSVALSSSLIVEGVAWMLTVGVE